MVALVPELQCRYSRHYSGHQEVPEVRLDLAYWMVKLVETQGMPYGTPERVEAVKGFEDAVRQLGGMNAHWRMENNRPHDKLKDR